MQRLAILAGVLILAGLEVRASEVSGRVAMPEVCAPEISPAVVSLEPVGGPVLPNASEGNAGEVILVDQRGLQFLPRVQVIALGQKIRFTNSDSETHSVHVVSPGFDFNQVMPAGQSRDWVPEKAGLVRLACDVHSHMRGYIIVSATPWAKACSREGRFRFDAVPEGRYVLNVWHEMGEPLRKEITIARGKDRALGTLTLAAPALPKGAAKSAPVRPWSDVIDRISVTLATSLDAATRPGGFKKARRLAEEAYFGEFEASDMETAVRMHLGFARKGALEDRFFAARAGVREVAEGRQGAEQLADVHRKLLLDLVRTADELNRKGITDRAHLFAERATSLAAPAEGDRHAGLVALARRFERIRALADRGDADEAASTMASAYFAEFEPLERFVATRDPMAVAPLEMTFNTIRGDLSAGLKGPALAARFDGLRREVETALGRSEAKPVGSFGPAFAASLVTILREGIEVILLLTMLVALVAKTGQAGAIRAIRWGVGLAVLASAGTAWGLNHLVASAQGQAREMVEGLVMLAASAVLFYVSYWLISQSESRRWMDFLKRRARRGAELGGLGTLAVTAFLAVYREGAETALMYQAMIGAQGHSQAGLLGLAAGLGIGLVLLAGIALLVRATSVRLPLRLFFQVSGFVLFAMAVVFAGNGVFELQSSGILKITPMNGLSWLGNGVPALGLYPTVQTLSVQALLLAGAGLALVLMLTGEEAPASPASKPTSLGPRPTAGAGA